MTANVFDVNYYRQANSDLAALSDAELTTHFLNPGVFEGRPFSRFADLRLYRASNPDLEQIPTIAGNNLALYNHLSQFGVQEGRTFSAFYSPQVYRGANLDLNTSGLDNEQLYNHFQASGFNEGRRFSAFYDPQFYRSNSIDLSGLSSPALFDHFQSSGLAENRIFSAFIDLPYYQSKNPDLVGLSNPQLLNHLQSSGLAEGRKFSAFVDVDFYLKYVSTYLDLSATATALNNNRVLAFQELQSSGLRQGQRFSPVVDLNFYRDYHPDLANLENYDLFNHLVLTGSQGGRRLSVSYDPIFYLNANRDLTGFSSGQLLDHFLSSGLNEDRQASDSYSPSFYLNNNSNLATIGLTTPQQALFHYEIQGLNEGLQANSVPIVLSGTAGSFLGNATNLGAFTRGRGGIINERVDNNSTLDAYRFTVATPSDITLQISNLTAQVNYRLVFDRNVNGQEDEGEFIGNIQTSTSSNIGGNLAAGTYYLVVQQAGNQPTNYRLNLSASGIGRSITTSRDPGESASTALDLGSLSLVGSLIEFNEFVGTADSSDVYRLSATEQGSSIGQIFNISSPVTAEVIIDSNANGLFEAGETKFTESGVNNIRLFVQDLPDGLITFYIRIQPNPATTRGTYSLG